MRLPFTAGLSRAYPTVYQLHQPNREKFLIRSGRIPGVRRNVYRIQTLCKSVIDIRNFAEGHWFLQLMWGIG